MLVFGEIVALKGLKAKVKCNEIDNFESYWVKIPQMSTSKDKSFSTFEIGTEVAVVISENKKEIRRRPHEKIRTFLPVPRSADRPARLKKSKTKKDCFNVPAAQGKAVLFVRLICQSSSVRLFSPSELR